MEISMVSLARMTLWALLMGIAFGIFYDVIRISRVMVGVTYGGIVRKSADRLYSIEYPLIGKIKRKESTLKGRFMGFHVAVGDLIFCTVVGGVLCIFFYYTNDGIFRWQALAASALGFFAYYKTVGALVISFAEIIYIFLKIFTKILLFAIAFPFRIMYNILIKVLNTIFGTPLRWFLKKIHVRATRRKMARLLIEADSGFLQNFLKGQGN